MRQKSLVPRMRPVAYKIQLINIPDLTSETRLGKDINPT